MQDSWNMQDHINGNVTTTDFVPENKCEMLLAHLSLKGQSIQFQPYLAIHFKLSE